MSAPPPPPTVTTIATILCSPCRRRRRGRGLRLHKEGILRGTLQCWLRERVFLGSVFGALLSFLFLFQFLSILFPSLTHTPYPAEGVEKDDDGVVLVRKGVLHPHIINHEVIIQCALSIEANSKNAFLLGFYDDVVF